jgi:valyl-tRNA synthetase
MPDLAKTYDPTLVEDKWYKFWEENDLFRTEVNSGREPFVIMMPPPNVTGILHMGHALQDSIQDALIRYYRMRGRQALWMPGTDHAGIATQNVVERDLLDRGIKREDLGREKFLAEVWKWKDKHGGIISKQKRRLGDSADWHRERFTLDEGMSEAVATAFVKLYYDKDKLVYRGYYIVNWCPRCSTAISDEEVDHRETQGHLWYIRYPLLAKSAVGGKDSDEYLTVATTRPETMLGDTAIAAHPDDERFLHLQGRIAILPVLNREIPIIFDDFVDPKFGTGLVKVTPAHDPNDFDIGKRHHLPQIIVIDEKGAMTHEAGPDFEGMDRFECREALVERLQELGLLEKIEPHTHAVGHCDRCKTVIEPYLSRQWFVKMKPLAEKAIKAVTEDHTIKFVPPRWEKVYLSWLEEIRDWCISRQLWWGHRIPVYTCEDCQHEWAAAKAPQDCEECHSKNFSQDPDVLDTWFSSWLWPFSTLGWPRESEAFRYFYPTQVLVSGYDIIFFWIARMIMAGLKFTERVPFRTVYITGMVKDELGRWMSKSLGNGIDPIEMIDQYGADAVRYSLVVLTTEGQDIKLAPSRFEMGRNFANKLWNAARFLLMQERPDRFSINEPAKLTLEDRWILSRLQRMLETVEDRVARFRLNEALLAIYEFTWHDYCDIYLETILKPRLYRSSDPIYREGMLAFALKIFETTLRALHPFMPFVTEELWQQIASIEGLDLNMKQPCSIMKQSYPIANSDLINPTIEATMEYAQELNTSARNFRAEKQVPKKGKIEIHSESLDECKKLEEYRDIIATSTGSTGVIFIETRPQDSVSAVIPGHGEFFFRYGGSHKTEEERVRERTRLDKEIARHEGLLQAVHHKLVNQEFLNNAPAAIIQRERQKKADIEATLEKLRRNRQSLD